MKEIVDLWPQWMRAIVKNSKDTDNIERIYCFKKDNYIDASASPTSKDTADKLG